MITEPIPSAASAPYQLTKMMDMETTIKRDNQVHHSLKGKTSGRVLDPAQRINGNSSRDRQDYHDQRYATDNSHDNTGACLWQRNQLGADEKLHCDASE